MFGHQDDQSSDQNSNDIPDESIHGVLNDGGGSGESNEQPATETTQEQAADQTWQHPGVPLDGGKSAPISDIIAAPHGGGSGSQPSVSIVPTSSSAASTDSPGDASTDDLIDIKQQALGELSPLIDHLEQSPEDKFRTTMMMIQASDNQSLIKDAYAAAHAIEDEKVRAQALLDIVNEINYFTQHQN